MSFPGDPNAFNQGHQESQPSGAPQQGNPQPPQQDPNIQVVSAPQPNQGQQEQQAPQQHPSGRVFTEEEVEAIRREEKEKLYGTIEELKSRVGELSESEKARLAAEEARLKAEEDARKAAEEAEMSAKELIERREAEWRQQMEEQSNQVLTLQQQIEQQNALMEQERQFQELQTYRNRRVQEEADKIMPHLQGMVTGNSPEEIEMSIAQLAATSAAIMQDMAQATNEAPRPNQQGPRVTMPPVGPMDTQSAQKQITPDDISNMSMEEYAQHRQALLASANRQVRDRGLYE